MERDILAEVNHPFIVKLHYGECGGRRPDATGVLCGGPGAGTLQVSRRQAEPLPQPPPSRAQPVCLSGGARTYFWLGNLTCGGYTLVSSLFSSSCRW